MANEPITREEMLLNAVATGEAANLDPITREEMFLAKLGGADVNTPTPITRKEQFLQKAIESGGTGGGSGVPKDWFNDGDTHIWITLPEGRTSPMLGIVPTGTVTVDWGDGTASDTLSGTGSRKFTQNHEYANTGDYVISLAVDGKADFSGYSYGYILSHSSANDERTRAYLAAVNKVELGTGVTRIGQNSFFPCANLTRISFSESVTNIDNDSFKNCYLLICCDFTRCTTIPTLKSTLVLNYIHPDCKILVPAALYDEWIVATNWVTYASKIVAV